MRHTHESEIETLNFKTRMRLRFSKNKTKLFKPETTSVVSSSNEEIRSCFIITQCNIRH